ncbi:hypothetical protein J32TS6_09650 [Virgibacillus pantothenticus]|uniref:hypothetical protein n=1 Tax=Virgibacillus pantothenticus TaxID=1473 RepID=UPI001B0A5A1A|nr:hypothetical protein [Virgibacillus pantothenticus]MBU8564895.1 hypothetical protein [Virgibacillus pantothenticus]MBU8599203.1 hypothetical protein [Virgibacillus pantothenticus]MBU8633394.1 hypothetical protein [Virgibacillus pantothenticus]MBU8640945.1 hypothetical protein [Virgibacillus pantothenticus]MBU8645126.1 hypothetical protein [Virgibacillus pantothenticus]
MSDIQKLEERIKLLETENQKLKYTMDLIDTECHKVSEKVKRLNYVVEEMAESSFSSKFNTDIEYVCLKLDLEPLQYIEVKCLPMKMEVEYRKTGKIPSIQECHEKLLEELGVPEKEKSNYPIEIIINMLKKFKKDMEEIGEMERAKSIYKIVNQK